MSRVSHRRPLVLLAAVTLLARPLAAQTSLAAAVQAQIDSIIAHSRIPGLTVGIALPGGSAIGLAAGVSDRTTGRKMRPDDLMLSGSVGKTYFLSVAMQLVAEGKLDLDAPVARYLGDLPYWNRIPNGATATVRQIMSHTSGIVRYEFNPRFLADLTAAPMRTFTPEQRLGYLFDTEAPFAPGEGWEYSDTNFILLAMIIERLTGRSAYDEIDARLIKPLGLSETRPSDTPRMLGLSQGYGGGAENAFGGFDEMVVDGAMVINPQFEWGGGGFASTARDLARYIKAIHEGEAFDAALLEQVRTGHPAPLGPRAQYGLGTIMMQLPAGTAWGHSGFMPGYRTEAYYFPDGKFALVLQLNTTARGAFPEPLLRVFNGIAMTVRRELEGR